MTSTHPDIIHLTGDGLRFLDQTRLPAEERIVETADYRDVLEAIRSLRVRGAPLIGIAAAYGTVLAAREICHGHATAANQPTGPSDTSTGTAQRAAGKTSSPACRERMLAVCDEFASTRPTAVNLFWALERMRTVIREHDTADIPQALEREAHAIHEDDARRCAAIGRHGAEIIPANAGIITHCNTGALATGGDGTAFSVLLEAHRQGKNIHVYADETRPLLQGARLTMWELKRAGIPSTLMTDSTAAMRMRQGGIGAVITGADRIAANGDSANKIGTYGLAVAARHHGIPFYIAAPLSTVDLALANGDAIPIEERASVELTRWGDIPTAPEGISTYTPAFDVTPAELINGIITEGGICAPPYRETLAAAFA